MNATNAPYDISGSDDEEQIQNQKIVDKHRKIVLIQINGSQALDQYSHSESCESQNLGSQISQSSSAITIRQQSQQSNVTISHCQDSKEEEEEPQVLNTKQEQPNCEQDNSLVTQSFYKPLLDFIEPIKPRRKGCSSQDLKEQNIQISKIQYKNLRVLGKGMASKKRMNQKSNSSNIKLQTVNLSSSEKKQRIINFKKQEHTTALEKQLQKNQAEFDCKNIIQSEENKKLIQQHKFQKLKSQNKILKIFNKFNRTKSSNLEVEESYDEYEYYRAIEQDKDELKRSKFESQAKWKEDYIISCYSKTRLKFEFVTCILILYDCIILPLHLGFGIDIFHPNIELVINSFDYVIKLVFIIDLLMGFRKAYINEDIGIEIRDPKLIAKNYLKFYFWIDLISGLPLDLLTDNYYLRLFVLIKIVRLRRLSKIVSFLNFSLQTRVRIRVFYLIIRMLIIIHWATCFYYYKVEKNYFRIKTQSFEIHDGGHIPWQYNYWIPQVDMAKKETTYFEQKKQTQYYIMLYYCILLVIGNDIMPMTMNEVMICTGFIFFGAFLEAYIIGGVTAELIKKEDKNIQNVKDIDYVRYSIEIHNFPEQMKEVIIQYIQRFCDNQELHADFEDFLGFLNPSLYFEITTNFYFKMLKDFEIFNDSHKYEVLFIVRLLKPRIFLTEEKVVTQGDFGSELYLISLGSCNVYQKMKLKNLKKIIRNNLQEKIISIKKKNPKAHNYINQRLGSSLENLRLRDDILTPKIKKKNLKSLGKTNNLYKQGVVMRKSYQNQLANSHHLYLWNSLSTLNQFTVEENMEFQEIKYNVQGFTMDEYFQMLQNQNKYPKKKDIINLDILELQKQIKHISHVSNDCDNFCLKFLPIQDELQNYLKINILEKGDIFGEITCMTKLERTCTIVTKENTMVHCLNRDGLDVIEEMFPKIYNSIYDKMQKYDDEDMIQRLKVVSNIPLFRGLSTDTIYQIIWEIDEKHNLTTGELILAQDSHCSSIFMVSEGIVQVRVSCPESDDNQHEIQKDYWLENLETGATFNVYNCMNISRQSIVNFIASSDNCSVEIINFSSILKLSKQIRELNNRLKKVKHLMRLDLVCDLDIFTFPRSRMKDNIIRQTDKQIINQRRNQNLNHKLMAASLLKYVKHLKTGKISFPPAIDTLQQVRNNRKIQIIDDGYLQFNVQEQLGQEFNIKQIYMEDRQQKFKDVLMRLRLIYYEFESFICDSNSTSINTSYDTYNFSIKCLSFDSKNFKVPQKRVTYSGMQSCSAVSSHQSMISSVTSQQNERVKSTLRDQIQNQRRTIIQIKKAINIMKETNYEQELFLEIYLKTIEKSIFVYKNNELIDRIYKIDLHQVFKQDLKLTQLLMKQIFTQFDQEEFELIYQQINDGFIIIKERKKATNKDFVEAMNQVFKQKTTNDGRKSIVKRNSITLELKKKIKKQNENEDEKKKQEMKESNWVYTDEFISNFKSLKEEKLRYSIKQMQVKNIQSIINQQRLVIQKLTNKILQQ